MSRSFKFFKSSQSFSVKENSWIARLAAAKLHTSDVAVTIGNTIHLYNTKASAFMENDRWVRHELAHIEQFRRYGLIRFIFLYLWESVRHGYYNNRFEKEAREAEHTESGNPGDN